MSDRVANWQHSVSITHDGYFRVRSHVSHKPLAWEAAPPAKYLVERTAKKSAPPEVIYPRSLIRAFALGILVFGFGVLVLLFGLVTKSDASELAAGTLLTIGSTIVTLSLLRGQYVDEQST